MFLRMLRLNIGEKSNFFCFKKLRNIKKMSYPDHSFRFVSKQLYKRKEMSAEHTASFNTYS